MRIVAGRAGHFRLLETCRIEQTHRLKSDNIWIARPDFMRLSFFRHAMALTAPANGIHAIEKLPAGVEFLTIAGDMPCSRAMAPLAMHSSNHILQHNIAILHRHPGRVTGKTAQRFRTIKLHAEILQRIATHFGRVAGCHVKAALSVIPSVPQLKQIAGPLAVSQHAGPRAGMRPRSETPINAECSCDTSILVTHDRFAIDELDQRSCISGRQIPLPQQIQRRWLRGS